MDKLSEVKDYISGLATKHINIDAFLYGDFERLNQYVSENPQDTILFMEWPEVTVDDQDGSYTALYEPGVYLLRYVDAQDWDARDTAYSDTLEIITDHLLPRMKQELFEQNTHFSISNTRDIEPVEFLTLAGLLGYKMTLSITTYKPLNEDNESVWSDRS